MTINSQLYWKHEWLYIIIIIQTSLGHITSNAPRRAAFHPSTPQSQHLINNRVNFRQSPRNRTLGIRIIIGQRPSIFTNLATFTHNYSPNTFGNNQSIWSYNVQIIRALRWPTKAYYEPPTRHRTAIDKCSPITHLALPSIHNDYHHQYRWVSRTHNLFTYDHSQFKVKKLNISLSN